MKKQQTNYSILSIPLSGTISAIPTFEEMMKLIKIDGSECNDEEKGVSKK